jgi:hypothetical protein
MKIQLKAQSRKLKANTVSQQNKTAPASGAAETVFLASGFCLWTVLRKRITHSAILLIFQQNAELLQLLANFI